MRRFFEVLPQVLMVDATHNTNDARYKLFSFMIHGVFGHGQYVQHILMENEGADCLTDAVTSVKSFNVAWDQVRVIIADKDFGEISLLHEAFPLHGFYSVYFTWQNIFATRQRGKKITSRTEIRSRTRFT
ncbi:hypothetical protein PI124_g6451 [Phytophthora idaei]|nr:hypothetical protein PI124_g6451 [Phytophthora idaei]